MQKKCVWLKIPIIFIPWLCFLSCCLFTIPKALQLRRLKCEHENQDPLVWTCNRVMKWIKDIDLKVDVILGEYLNLVCMDSISSQFLQPCLNFCCPQYLQKFPCSVAEMLKLRKEWLRHYDEFQKHWGKLV